MKFYQVNSDFLRELLEAHKCFCACKIRRLISEGLTPQDITREKSDAMTDEFMNMIIESIPPGLTHETTEDEGE